MREGQSNPGRRSRSLRLHTLSVFVIGGQLLSGQYQNSARKFSVPDSVEVKPDLVYAEYGGKSLRLANFGEQSGMLVVV